MTDEDDFDALVDAALDLGVILVPDPDTGVAWVADRGTITPPLAANLARLGPKLRPLLVDEPRMIGAALRLFGNRPGVVAWLVSLGHNPDVVRTTADFHRLPALDDDEPWRPPEP